MSGVPVLTPIVYTSLTDKDCIHIVFALAHWFVVDMGRDNTEPTWPLAQKWLHTEMSVTKKMDTMVAFVHVLNCFPHARQNVDVHSVSAIGDAATDAIKQAWEDFAPHLPNATVARVASILGWPSWIQEQSEQLRRHTFDVFYPSEIHTVNRAMTEDFVCEMRVMAMFYDVTGQERIASVMTRKKQ